MTAGGRWLLLALLALGALLLVAFSRYAQRPPASVRPAYGGRYVEAVVGAPSRINPLFALFNEIDRDLTSLIFSGLTRLGPDATPLPDLAEGWQVSADGRTYTFRLRRGALWHDGTPFGADDVLFTWAAVRDPAFRGEAELAQFWRSLSFAKADDYTVTVTLPEPYAPLLAHVALGILPKHKLAGVKAEDLWDSAFNRSPVGTGPFRLRQLTAGAAILAANPSYHRGRPYLDEIELRFFPDQVAALAALRKGEVAGFLVGPGEGWRAPDKVEGSVKGVRVLTATAAQPTLVYLNSALPPFREPKVRQALLYALDRQRLVEVALGGQGVPADSPIAPGSWADGGSSALPHDRARAVALLREAGWRRGGGGPWEKEGWTLSFTLATNDHPQREAVGREVVRQWREIGVAVELVVRPPSALVRELLLPRSYQAALLGWEPGPDPDPYPAWHSSQRGAEGGNLADYSDRDMDDLLARARQTPDLQERRQLYSRFQALFAAQLPGLPLYFPRYVYLVDGKLRGAEVGVLLWPASRFAQAHRWYLKTAPA